MSKSMSLEAARAQLNIPKNVPDAEVLKIAAEYNIVIDFSAEGNNQELNIANNDLENNSVFSFGGNNNNYTFGNEDSFSFTNPMLTQPSVYNAKVDTKADGYTEMALDESGSKAQEAANEIQLTAAKKESLFEATSSFFSNILGLNLNKEKFIQDIDKTAAANEVSENAEVQENANQTEVSADTPAETDTTPKNHWEYDGKGHATLVDSDGNPVKGPNGKDVVRKAHHGEPGYKKDGESIDERITRYFGKEAVEKAKTDEEKIALLERYFVKHFDALKNKKNPDGTPMYTEEELATRKYNDFVKLCRNTDRNSEFGKLFGNAMHSLDGSYKKKALDNAMQEEKIETQRQILMSAMDNMKKSANDPKAQAEFSAAIINYAKEKNCDVEVYQTALKQLEHLPEETHSLIIQVLYENVDKYKDNIDTLIEKLGIQNADGKKILSDKNANAIIQNEINNVKTKEDVENLFGRLIRGDGEYAETVYLKGFNIEDEELRKHFGDLASNRVQDIKNGDKQLAVSKIILANDDEDHTYAQNMASHVDEVNEEVRRDFAKFLTDLQAENVSSELAKKVYNLDESSREAIVKDLKEQGFEKTLKALEEAQANFDANQAQIKVDDIQPVVQQKAAEVTNDIVQAEVNKNVVVEEDSKPKTSTKSSSVNNEETSEYKGTSSANREASTSYYAYQAPVLGVAPVSSQASESTNNSSSEAEKNLLKKDGKTATAKVLSEDFKKCNPATKVKYLESLTPTAKQQAISTIVENFEGYQLRPLMTGETKNQILRYLLVHQSPSNNEKLKYIETYLSAPDKEELNKMREDIEKRKNGNVAQNNPFG